jgi:hypothetical protein
MQSEQSESNAEALATLEARIHAILPPQYAGSLDDISSESMGTAKLKFDADGKVAWGEIWTTFCHLSLAGGPPHRGRFLNPVPTKMAQAYPEKQAAVVREMQRAILLSSQLKTIDAERPGWVGVQCHDEDMASWLVRAIIAENVSAYHRASRLFVPAGPFFRVKKEIKNVVVSLAKCCHYLLGHVEDDLRPRGLTAPLIGAPFLEEIAASPSSYRNAADKLAQEIRQRTGQATGSRDFSGWLRIDCDDVSMAIWMMRAIIVENVLARHEGNLLFVPVPMNAQESMKVAEAVHRARRHWQIRSEQRTRD